MSILRIVTVGGYALFSLLRSSAERACEHVFVYTKIQNKSCLSPTNDAYRCSHTFLSRTTAEQLWKGVTSVSPAGRKKGRGSGTAKKIAKDLNRGQVIGFGKTNMLWPGLNAPVVQGREVIEQRELPPDESREKRLHEIRDKMVPKRFFKLHPLERGWSSNKLPGRHLGPPDPVGEETFEGFDSICLKFITVMHVTAQRGKVRQFSALVVTGNGNGLAGFSIGKSIIGTSAAKSAKNKAANVLRYIERDNNHTVLHDFYTEYGAVKIFVKKKPEGYGLVCHRAIKAICEMIGIKDLYAKVEGPTGNTLCVTRAFFIGLMRQKSHQQLAEEKGLHVVEMKKNRDLFPVLLASPIQCRNEKEIDPTEQLDFRLHLHNGVEKYREPFKPFYINFPSYIKEMKDREFMRNHRDVRISLISRYGALKSFLTEREEKKAKENLEVSVNIKE